MRSCCCRSIRNIRRTTTGSSLTAWREAAARAGLVADTTVVCCYPTDADYVAASRRCCARRGRRRARSSTPESASGSCSPRMACLNPSSGRGDPYQWQIEQTVGAVLARWGRARGLGDLLSVARDAAALDRTQHRGGDRACRAVTASPCWWCRSRSSPTIPRRWSSSTSTIARWRSGLACRAISASRRRTPTPRSSPHWRDLVRRARTRGPGLCSHAGGRICPADRSLLPAGMTIGFLAVLYPWTKAFHVIAMIAWMAGMLYLPRLYVYHCDAAPGFGGERALQGDGAAAAEADHQPGDDRDLDVRRPAGADAGHHHLVGRLVAREACRWCC